MTTGRRFRGDRTAPLLNFLEFAEETMEYILGHDFGSSGDKACIFDREGQFLAEAYYTYDTSFSSDGGAFQNSADWWKAMCVSTNEVIEKAGIRASQIAAISFGTQGNALLPVGKGGEILRPEAVIWMDSRSVKEAEQIRERIPEERYYAITGNAFEGSMRPSAKLLYMKKHERELLEKTWKLIGAKEFLVLKLTGKFGFTDYGDASGSCMFDIHTKKYSGEILDAVGIPEYVLPEPRDCAEVVGTVTEEAARQTGLCPGTPVVLGTWDNFACATGAGVRKKGTCVSYLGTAGWLGVDSDIPLGSEEARLNVVYVGRNEYHNSAHSHAACMSYNWVLDRTCGSFGKREEKFAKAEELAGRVPAGSEGVYFIPAMLKGNTFYQAAHLRGSFLGLRPEHHCGHLIRAAMEGVGYDLMLGVDTFKRRGAPIQGSTIIGGGAKNNLWVQILADMFGIPMARPANMQHVGAWGAAIIAGVGTGLYSGFEEISGKLETESRFEPDPSIHEVYREKLPDIEKIYKCLLRLYSEIG